MQTIPFHRHAVPHYYCSVLVGLQQKYRDNPWISRILQELQKAGKQDEWRVCDPCGNCVCCRHAADTGAADRAVTVECAVVADADAVECSGAAVDTGVAEGVSADVGTDNAQVTSAPRVMITEEESGAAMDTGVAEGVSAGDADTGSLNAEGDACRCRHGLTQCGRRCRC